ncbi:MAG: three-Cys-motif partner protein TcmP [Limisphaerales bacterium]
MNNNDRLYEGREQTLVKHIILRNYLLRLALIVGSWSKAIHYIDCFSGPWNVRGENYEDSSFGIAISELRKAREKLSERSIPLKLRCFFLEENPIAYSKLAAFTEQIDDIEVETQSKRLEESISDILSFHKRSKPSFPFVFIDPTGWTGFPLNLIRPLLQLKPSEVLINFMTWHARRFIESEQERANFDALFGDSDWRSEIAGLSGDERDDAMVRLYASRIREAGQYAFVAYTPVLHRADDTTHFHLIYATRSEKGLEVFKDAERQAVALMEQKRAEAQQSKRTAGGQTLLFGSAEMHNPEYYDKLRTTYLRQATERLETDLVERQLIDYDEAWSAFVNHPLVWEKDLRDQISLWRKSGHLNIPGLPARQVPKRGRNMILQWMPQ